jgi:hypothetical protein
MRENQGMQLKQLPRSFTRFWRGLDRCAFGLEARIQKFWRAALWQQEGNPAGALQGAFFSQAGDETGGAGCPTFS